MLDRQIAQASQQTLKRVSGKVGPLSASSQKTLDEYAARVKRDVGRAQEVLVFEQQFEGVPLDNSGLRVLRLLGDGVLSISGRVFNVVEPGNRRRLSEAQAAEAARKHVGRSTKVLAAPPGTKPEPVVLPYGATMLHAWRLDVAAEGGSYRVWVDAETGKILQLRPLFFSDSATGRVFNPAPTTTQAMDFEVDAAAGGSYQLLLTGIIDENNSGADSVSSTDLTLAAASGVTTANFDVAPINGTTVDRTNLTGYNSRFQEVNAFAWISSNIKSFESFGSPKFPALTVNVNHANPCAQVMVSTATKRNNACAFTATNTIQYGIGQATVSTSTAAADFFNSALDATVVTHELGHILDNLQVVTIGGGTMTASINEGLSDFWAATIHNNSIFGGYWGTNQGTPVQTGFAPRQAEASDVFPEHRAGNAEAHADGQIIDWALWSTRAGLNGLSALGTLSINTSLMKALTTAGGGITDSLSDKDVHDSYLDLEKKLLVQFGTNGDINKVLAGFARAGICLSERDAIIDIDDDFLAQGSPTGPTFTVFGGRDYEFPAPGSTAATSSAFNTQFEIEVANDAAFTVNRVTSGLIGTIAVSTQGVPLATWTLPTASWNTLKTGTSLFYRVTTKDGTGGNARISTSPGNGSVASVDPPRAVINASGSCECTCGASASPIGSGVAWVTLIGPLAALVWRRRLRGPKP